MQRSLSIAIVTILFLFGGCSSTPTKPPSQPTMANTKCPMSGDALDGNGPTIFFNSDKIGFCCRDCIGKFAVLDGAAKQAKIDSVK